MQHKQYKLVQRLIFGAAALGIMALIFSFSSQNGSASGSLSGEITQSLARMLGLNPKAAAYESQWDALHFLVRKGAHFGIYFALGLCVYGCAETWLPPLRSVCTAGLIGCLYAASDEFHQSFVAGRGPSVIDVLLDTAGALCGAGGLLGVLWLLKRLHRRCSKGRNASVEGRHRFH